MKNQLKRKAAKIIFFLIIISIVITKQDKCFAQNSIDYDTIQIHKLVVDKLSENKYLVVKNTDKSPILDFNFQDPTQLDTSSTLIWKRNDWKMFLNKIDTSNIRNYILCSKGKYWFKSSYKLPKNDDHTITFAPVFISTERDKALVLLRTYHTLAHSGSNMAFFLEKEKSIWKIRHLYTYEYLD